uniref:Uncharacterized protein n=1 Tax=Ditylenchus dipsaci TaxID=166011 RepID=A0A915D411_9BILA
MTLLGDVFLGVLLQGLNYGIGWICWPVPTSDRSMAQARSYGRCRPVDSAAAATSLKTSELVGISPLASSAALSDTRTGGNHMYSNTMLGVLLFAALMVVMSGQLAFAALSLKSLVKLVLMLVVCQLMPT